MTLTAQSSLLLAMMLSLKGLHLMSSTGPPCPLRSPGQPSCAPPDPVCTVEIFSVCSNIFCDNYKNDNDTPAGDASTLVALLLLGGYAVHVPELGHADSPDNIDNRKYIFTKKIFDCHLKLNRAAGFLHSLVSSMATVRSSSSCTELAGGVARGGAGA